MPYKRVLTITTLLVASSVGWRYSVYYSGGVDSVVVAKAALNVVALLMAIALAASTRDRRPVGMRSVILLGSYVCVSMFGAWAASDVVASGVLAARILIVASTLVLLLRAVPAVTVLTCLAASMGVVAFLAAVTALPTLDHGQRLSGGIPPIPSNELALTSAVPMIVLVWRNLHGRSSLADPLLVTMFGVFVWLSGSRTALVALLVVFIVMLVQARRLPVLGFLILLGTLPVMIYVTFGTPVVTEFFARGGSEEVGTLNNRTTAWSAALDLAHDFWSTWFGSGLARKQIEVGGQWWEVQGLDSSWMSALVQAGRLGLILFAVLVMLSLLAAFGTVRPQREIMTALLLFLVARSVLESGLMDATAQFLVFFTICVGVERTSPHPSGNAGLLADARRSSLSVRTGDRSTPAQPDPDR